ncbi:lipid storage droplets surface-binding protein 2 [Linepithema humile]|uniref:lipid storage droplets surface-binding protein 2 n=1 Tax=Linepithema humile TaxID=83485 RepID=UPI00351EEEB1
MAEVTPKTTSETTSEVTPNELTQLKVIERVKELPIIEMAINKSAETYSKVKDSNQLVNWALSTAESSLNTAKKHAMPIAVPIAKKFEYPIGFVDNTLCLGLDKIEEKVPLVKEQPAQILEKAVSRISYVNDLIIAQATNLRDFSWSTANHLLETPYGIVAVKGVEGTAFIVDKLIDKYFPPTEEEEEEAKEKETTEIKTDEEDKLLRTLQTVGHLSNKAARRVYTHVIYQLHILKESSLTLYVNSLVEFLHLTKYLYTMTEKAEKNEKEKEKEKEKIHVNGEKKEESQKKQENEEERDTKKEDAEKEKNE